MSGILPDERNNDVNEDPQPEADTGIIREDVDRSLVNNSDVEDQSEADTGIVQEDVDRNLINNSDVEDQSEADTGIVQEDVDRNLVNNSDVEDQSEADTGIVQEDVDRNLINNSDVEDQSEADTGIVQEDVDRNLVNNSDEDDVEDQSEADTGIVQEDVDRNLVNNSDEDDVEDRSEADTGGIIQQHGGDILINNSDLDNIEDRSDRSEADLVQYQSKDDLVQDGSEADIVQDRSEADLVLDCPSGSSSSATENDSVESEAVCGAFGSEQKLALIVVNNSDNDLVVLNSTTAQVKSCSNQQPECDQVMTAVNCASAKNSETVLSSTAADSFESLDNNNVSGRDTVTGIETTPQSQTDSMNEPLSQRECVPENEATSQCESVPEMEISSQRETVSKYETSLIHATNLDNEIVPVLQNENVLSKDIASQGEMVPNLSKNVSKDVAVSQTVSDIKAAQPTKPVSSDNVPETLSQNEAVFKSDINKTVPSEPPDVKCADTTLNNPNVSLNNPKFPLNTKPNSNNTSSNDKPHISNGASGYVAPQKHVRDKPFPISRKSPPGIDFLHLSDSSEDELLNDLDEALLNKSPSKKKAENPTKPLNTNMALPNGLKPLLTEQNAAPSQKQLYNKDEDPQTARICYQTLQQKFNNLEKEKTLLESNIKLLKEQTNDNLYLPQLMELEKTIAAQEKEIQQTKETLTNHDSLAKRKIASMQTDYKARIEQVTRMYEDCLKEKDTMVMNYAVAEQKNIEAKKATEKAESKYRDSLKDQEAQANKLKSVKIEKQKVQVELETRENEISAALREIERFKEMLTSADVRIKWAQNKLKGELESHKETKIELEKTNQKLKMAREETMQIRKDCQAMVKTYQESEEIKSNSLDKKLKLTESELIVQRQEKSDSHEVYITTVRELDSLKSKHKDAMAELKTLRDKVYCLESERRDNEETMTKYKDIMQKQKGENRNIQDKVKNLTKLEEDFNRAEDMIKTLDKEISELRMNNKDLQIDIEGCRTRETELLELTQKLSRTNAKLQSESTNASNQVVSLTGKCSNMEMEIQNLEMKCKNVNAKFMEDKNTFESECIRLKAELSEQLKLVSDLKQKLEDEKDSIKTLKRKHANNIKDITRQLQQTKKKIDILENHGEKDGTSLGSRTSSNGSLNTITDNHNHHTTNHQQQVPVQPVRIPEPEYPVITEQVEVDKQVLIERIVRLQKAHARKNEKLEFLQDHIHQLVDEVQRKKRLIQSYILREEQGALAPEAMDENKALLAKKGGIMASLYSHHSQDGHMTLDLSLEINQKLQGVLEDTLLKNITLKENIDTLGTEIARLSKENRQLQLHLQGLH